MTVSIDTGTIILAVILVDVFLVFLIISYKSILKDKSLKMFLAAKITQMATFILWALSYFFYGNSTTVYPNAPALIVTNVLFMLSIALECLAVLFLYNEKRKRTKMVYLVMTACFSVAFVLFYAFGAQQPLRIEAISLFCIAFVAYPAMYLLMNKNGSNLQRTMGILYLLVTAVFFSRVLIAAGVFTDDPALQEESHSWANFALFVMMIFSGSGVFAPGKREDGYTAA